MIRFNKDRLDMINIPRAAAEKLIALSGNCARLYVYGLLRSEADVEQMMAELDLDRKAVLSGLSDISAAGLMEVSADGGYAYAVPVPDMVKADSPVYNNADFNDFLQKTFGDRTLTFDNYKSIYRQMELNGLSGQVMLMLCEYAVTNHKAKNRVPMSYISSLAKSWGKDGVVTVEDAESKIRELRMEHSAEAVLNLLGIRRLPTEEEEELYKKWTDGWGFTFEGIKAAMPATTGAQYPTMKYLNGILEKLRDEGALSEQAVRRRMEEGEKTDAKIKKILERLPTPRKTVTKKSRTMFRHWEDLGFTLAEMTFAADIAAKRGTASLDYMDTILRDWASRGLYEISQIEPWVEDETAVRNDAREMLSAAGINKAVSGGDIAAYTRFTETLGFSKDVVMFAAKCAYGMKFPIKAMETMLSEWQKKGVATVEQAAQANAAHEASRTDKSQKSRPRAMQRDDSDSNVVDIDPEEIDLDDYIRHT